MAEMDRERLVNELARLPEAERRAIERDARARARKAPATLPWSVLRPLIGTVHGERADAVADTDSLYDG